MVIMLSRKLEEFVHIVCEICPWVPEGGFLDEATWLVIGSSPTTPDPHDLAEQGSVSHGPYPTTPAAEPLTEVLEDTTPQSTLPQWSPGPVTFTMPPDLAKQLHDVLSLCSRVLTVQHPHSCYLVSCQASLPASLGSLVPVSSPALSPVSPLSHALLSMGRGFPEADNLFPVLYPVMQSVDDQGRASQAVAQYGPTAPYTLTLLDNLSFFQLPPTDWNRLARACLSGGDFLLWKAYEEAASEQVRWNRRQQSPVTLDMLMGRGEHEDLNDQINMPNDTYSQINSLALCAWRLFPSSTSKTEQVSRIHQGPDEPYQDFVSRLMQSVNCQITDEDTASMLVKQLAFESANAACQAAIRPWHHKMDLQGYIHLCADIPSGVIDFDYT
ncbi:Gag polyprotein, partial [Plecturocebus cupreus]